MNRRELLGLTSAGVTLGLMGCSVDGRPAPAAGPASAGGRASPGPYDTFRELVTALDARGQLVRIAEIDQDAYESTALMYRLIDRHGMEAAPAVRFDRMRIGGEWLPGPVIGNYMGHWEAEALVFGIQPVPDDPATTFRRVKQHLMQLAADNGGNYPQIPPVTIDAGRALCKQVILRDEAIDLTRFPFMQVNPADGGRYLNTASVFTADPRLGINFGTYRCQLKGPRKIAVSPGEGQTGWLMLNAARARGETTARVTLVLGQDPIVYFVSGSRVANRQGNKPVDELAVAGGLRGRPVEVVRCETNDFMVPAHAEMIIEGEIPLDDLEPEGPYGESLGYQGKGGNAYWMRVDCVTHRRDPWFHNSYTGIDRGPFSVPGIASATLLMKRFAPEVTDLHYRSESRNVNLVSIDKTKPGQGMAVGEVLCRFNPVAKVVIVVDKDVDLLSVPAVMAALSARWQPHPAVKVFEDLPGLPMDPSQRERMRTSKIVIDATRQWPEEGGPAEYPPANRALLEAGAPEAFARVDEKFAKLLGGS